jgi:hypothetical protein
MEVFLCFFTCLSASVFFLGDSLTFPFFGLLCCFLISFSQIHSSSSMAETPSPTPNAAEVEKEKQEKLKKEYLKLRGHYSVQAHKALMDSFVLYDVVFDIRLLYDLERGWIIRGRDNVAPESMTAIGGRAIACYGEHDAGKTFFFKNLLNIQLAPGLSISTSTR